MYSSETKLSSALGKISFFQLFYHRLKRRLSSAKLIGKELAKHWIMVQLERYQNGLVVFHGKTPVNMLLYALVSSSCHGGVTIFLARLLN
jgi:hypothetical protein